MAVTAGMLARAAATALSNEKLRKGIGWVLVAVLSPVILLIAVLCSIGTGGAEHNNYTVSACFYGPSYSEEVPAEFQTHITEMRSAFSLLDSAVAVVNVSAEDGGAANRYVECFYRTETRTRTVEVMLEDGTTSTEEESYTVNVPISREASYLRLAALLGREITQDDKENAEHIYRMIVGSMGEGNYDGSFLAGGDRSIELDVSAFTDPTTKNAADLVIYAIHAWGSGWGYVWGTYGNVLTESLLAYKLEQYPDGVGNYEDLIRANWLDGRTTDCVGLIKGYGWLNAETMEIQYGTHEMPDIGANQMYYNATESGAIDTMPDIPGLAVWHEGHIGVYIGGGQVIEAMGTRYGVVKTELANRGWTHWLKIPYINYD